MGAWIHGPASRILSSEARPPSRPNLPGRWSRVYPTSCARPWGHPRSLCAPNLPTPTFTRDLHPLLRPIRITCCPVVDRRTRGRHDRAMERLHVGLPGGRSGAGRLVTARG